MEHSIVDLQFIKQRYARAGNRFKPRHIQTLLVTEGPPDNLDRYFYFEDVKKHDSLFLEVMGILYPEQKKRYLASGRDTLLKEELLESFKEDGYWLVALSELPCTLLKGTLESCIPSLIQRMKEQVDTDTPVILIQSRMYDICYATLIANGFNVRNVRIPFPGSGQQRVFREKFKAALNG